MDRDNDVCRRHLLSLLSLCLPALQANCEIKAYNQILLIGLDCGDQLRVSPLVLSAIPRLAQQEEWQWVLGGFSTCQSRIWAPTKKTTCWHPGSHYLSMLLPWSGHILHCDPSRRSTFSVDYSGEVTGSILTPPLLAVVLFTGAFMFASNHLCFFPCLIPIQICCS